MAKYEYIHGERRYYRGVTIWYDLPGTVKVGYESFGKCHWYLETCTTLFGSRRTANPVKNVRIQREYFQSLADARQYIDDF